MNSVEKTICVIGLGYIGLPTAALLANRGFLDAFVRTAVGCGNPELSVNERSALDFCGVNNAASCN